MGVPTTHYVFLGIKFSYAQIKEKFGEDYETIYAYHDNAYQDEITSKNLITVIADGMNGEYVLIGRVIEKAVTEHGNGLEMTDCHVTSKQLRAIEDIIKNEFGLTGKASVYAFTYYH